MPAAHCTFDRTCHSDFRFWPFSSDERAFANVFQNVRAGGRTGGRAGGRSEQVGERAG